MAVVVVDAVNRDGGTLFGVLSALNNNKQRYIQFHETPDTEHHTDTKIYFIENDIIECNYMCLFVRHIHLTLTPDMHSIRSVCAYFRGVGATEV